MSRTSPSNFLSYRTSLPQVGAFRCPEEGKENEKPRVLCCGFFGIPERAHKPQHKPVRYDSVVVGFVRLAWSQALSLEPVIPARPDVFSQDELCRDPEEDRKAKSLLLKSPSLPAGTHANARTQSVRYEQFQFLFVCLKRRPARRGL